MLTHNEITQKLHDLTSYSLRQVDESTHTCNQIELRKLVWQIVHEREDSEAVQKLLAIKTILEK